MKNTTTTFKILYAIFGIVFAVIIVKLYILSIARYKHYNKLSVDNTIKTEILVPTRQLESMLNIESNFVVVYVWILYVLYAAGVMLSSMLFKTSILDISIIFVYYAIADSILTLIYSYMFKESKNEKYNNYI